MPVICIDEAPDTCHFRILLTEYRKITKIRPSISNNRKPLLVCTTITLLQLADLLLDPPIGPITKSVCIIRYSTYLRHSCNEWM